MVADAKVSEEAAEIDMWRLCFSSDLGKINHEGNIRQITTSFFF